MILFKFIKIQITKDYTKERVLYVNNILSQSILSFYLYTLFNKSLLLKTAIALIWSFYKTGRPKINISMINCLYSQQNEYSGLTNLIKLLPTNVSPYYRIHDLNQSSLNTRLKFIASFFKHPNKSIQIIKILFKVSKRYPLFVCARVSQMILYYYYFKSTKFKTNDTWFLISTESNPHASALMALAQQSIIKIGFVAHSPYIANASPLYLDLAILWNSFTLEQIQNKNGLVRKTFIAKTNDTSSEQRKNNHSIKDTIVIALSKNPNWVNIDSIVKQLKHKRPEFKLVIRPHPAEVMTTPENFKKYINKNTSLTTILRTAYLLIAGNSTVHIESIQAGVPCFFCDNIDSDKMEHLQFIAEGEIPLIQDADLSIIERFDLEALKKTQRQYVSKFDGPLLNKELIKEITDYFNL